MSVHSWFFNTFVIKAVKTVTGGTSWGWIQLYDFTSNYVTEKNIAII